ncbi:aspergillopepsin-2 heavy chain [Diplodia corticola]|uniref:Aspergillopepsin-2 heavy chain n=1 Tax=Diplodia corticola TaxID=236234 RepID=A0A1J9SD35_9PEZI|nr:aspergillopepsin-2 heavy chain [Diplodia corticola]OJD37764.1 aspergillopepsin-2 heavy chain [Diplodia corticola]
MKVTTCLSGGLTLLLGLLLAGLTFAAGAGETGLATAPDKLTRNVVTTSFSPNYDKWAGVVFPQPPSSGHFTAVQASFTVPKVTIPVGFPPEDYWEAAINVGFGGTTGSNNYWIQVGILLTVQASGESTYRAFHVWYPKSDAIFDDSELAISEGDVVTMRVEAYSLSTGIAIVENHTTGKGVHKILDAPANAPPLLGHHAEWFIAEPVDNQLANFSTVQFTNAVAYTSDGRNIGPEEGGALISTIRDGWKLMTDTVLGTRELTVTFDPRVGKRRAMEKRTVDPVRPGGSAGVRFVQPLENDNYRAIQGTFIVPALSVPGAALERNYTAVVAVKIGGTAQDDEPSSSVGVNLIVAPQMGNTVWYEPFFKMGGVEHYFNDFPIAQGDVLALQLEFDNANGTSGRGTITKHGNLNSGNERANATITLTGGDVVQGYHAEWVVTDPFAKNVSEFPAHEPFPDFDTVEFTDTLVETTSGRKAGPGDANGNYVESMRIYGPGGVPMTDVLIGTTLVSIVYKPLPEEK